MGIALRKCAEKLDDDPLLLAERFHGHLGPYLVLGYRMGSYARRTLAVSPFNLRAEVFTGLEPPLSCLIDGVQVGSCCTLGKGNIKVHDEGRPEALFTTGDGATLRLRVRDWVVDMIESKVNNHNMIEYSEKLWSEPDERLFESVEI